MAEGGWGPGGLKAVEGSRRPEDGGWLGDPGVQSVYVGSRVAVGDPMNRATGGSEGQVQSGTGESRVAEGRQGPANQGWLGDMGVECSLGNQD